MTNSLILAGLSSILIAGLVQCSPGSPSVVSHSLLSKVRGGQRANITIVINSPVSKVFAQYHGKSYPQRGQLMTSMRQHLIDYTAETQAPVRSFLQSKGVSFKASWISNRIFVRNVEESLILELVSTLRSSIEKIREEIIAHIGPIEPVFVEKAAIRAPTLEIELVGAPKLWDLGITGEGIIVSHIDTGVRGDHEALAPNFLGEYGWYDAVNETETPSDETGHGTHTMGTLAGQNGIGVAPGAKWMACDACGADCLEEHIFACAEFTVCPHLHNGSNPDCSKAPHVSSNSWSSDELPGGWFDDAIAAMKSAGIIPVFSAGNFGSECGTLESPGYDDVIDVAATDFNDVIADFSSRGPAPDGSIKPDISAPGVYVLSSWKGGFNHYVAMNGTSMACPHVAGAVALLIASNPALQGDYEAVRSAILDNAQKTGLNGGGQTCGGIPDSQYPNSVLGHGRLDIPASVGI